MPARNAEIPEEVRDFHRECVVLDLHVDTLLWTRLLGYDMARRHRNRLPGAPFAWHFDLPRAAEGGLDAVVFGLVINPRTVHPELLGPLKALARLERSRGFEQTLATLGLLEEAARRHPDPLRFARSGSEVREAVSQGKLAGIAGLEGSHGIEGNLDNVRHAYERGLRLIGLVHFQRTEAAYPMTVAEFDDRGLTSFGRQLIGEMERLGMLVDLAHVNGAGIEDALAMLRQPYVVSHTACRALHDVPRNLSDEQIRRVAEHGGVVGMAFGRSFLGRPGLAGLLDHLEHAIRVGGADAVALGSDYDGAIVPATGLGDVTVLPRITAGLLARGQSHETVRKVMGENALRVLTEVCG